MENKKYQSLDMKEFNSKKSIFVSSKKSLEDIVPFNWNKDVLEGKRKVTVTNF